MKSAGTSTSASTGSSRRKQRPVRKANGTVYLRSFAYTETAAFKERQVAASTKHGMHKTPEYQAWINMRSRCHGNYARPQFYSGRGIEVCDKWRASFDAFYRDMGPRPGPRHSVDRIDNSKGYSPDNCRWADNFTQASNTRRNRLVTINGKTQCISAWAREVGLHRHTIRHRLNSGWSPEEAVYTPPPGR